MNLPNRLTLSRIVLTFIFVYFVSQHGLPAIVFATIVFFLASLTDYWDGYLAKKYHMVTDFGKLMDPIADKFLILAAFIVFVYLQIVQAWMVILILGREIIITSFRLFALSRKSVLAAEKAGKHKTVSQIVAIFAILGFMIFKESLATFSKWSGQIQIWWQCSIDILMVITVTLTLISGFSFIWGNRKLIHDQ